MGTIIAKGKAKRNSILSIQKSHPSNVSGKANKQKCIQLIRARNRATLNNSLSRQRISTTNKYDFVEINTKYFTEDLHGISFDKSTKEETEWV